MSNLVQQTVEKIEKTIEKNIEEKITLKKIDTPKENRVIGWLQDVAVKRTIHSLSETASTSKTIGDDKTISEGADSSSTILKACSITPQVKIKYLNIHQVLIFFHLFRLSQLY